MQIFTVFQEPTPLDFMILSGVSHIPNLYHKAFYHEQQFTVFWRKCSVLLLKDVQIYHS